MIIFTLMYTADDRTKVDKTTSDVLTLEGSFKKPTDIENPVITVQSSNNLSLKKMNYAYINVFGRYYFIEDIAVIQNEIYEISLHVDVLKSFSTAIKEQYAIIDRTADTSKINKYLNDSNYIVNSDPYIATIPFKNNGDTFSFGDETSWVLIVAGNNDETEDEE